MKETQKKSLLGQLRVMARELPGAEEYVMVHHPAFRVGKRPFAIAGLGAEALLSINLGVDLQRELLDDPRFSRTPYIGQHGWVSVSFAALGIDEARRLVEESWARVAGRRHLAERAGSGGDGASAPKTRGAAGAKAKPRGTSRPGASSATTRKSARKSPR